MRSALPRAPRAVVGLLTLAALAQPASARGDRQTRPPAQTTPPAPAAPAAPAKPPATLWSFDPDAGLMFFQVAPGKSGEFEGVVRRIKDALAKSTNPARRKQAAGWQLFSSTEPPTAAGVTYVFLLNPISAEADYDPVKILTEEFPSEAQALFATLKGASPSVTRMGLKRVLDMSVGR